MQGQTINEKPLNVDWAFKTGPISAIKK